MPQWAQWAVAGIILAAVALGGVAGMVTAWRTIMSKPGKEQPFQLVERDGILFIIPTEEAYNRYAAIRIEKPNDDEKE